MTSRSGAYVPLPREFFLRDPSIVAPALLGAYLVRTIDATRLIGRIVETEAYLSKDDPAAHGYKGRLIRNLSLFGNAGHAYVHRSRHHTLLDIVTEDIDIPSGVLIRAIEPIAGLAIMRALRGTDAIHRLGSGPGKLCKALGVTKAHDGIDMTDPMSELFVSFGETVAETDVTISTRIGISAGKELPLRFSIASSPFVSR